MTAETEEINGLDGSRLSGFSSGDWAGQKSREQSKFPDDVEDYGEGLYGFALKAEELKALRTQLAKPNTLELDEETKAAKAKLYALLGGAENANPDALFRVLKQPLPEGVEANTVVGEASVFSAAELHALEAKDHLGRVTKFLAGGVTLGGKDGLGAVVARLQPADLPITKTVVKTPVVATPVVKAA